MFDRETFREEKSQFDFTCFLRYTTNAIFRTQLILIIIVLKKRRKYSKGIAISESYLKNFVEIFESYEEYIVIHGLYFQ